MNDLSPFVLSLIVALTAMTLLLPVGLWASYRLGVGKPFRGRAFVETLITLPLVLPPTVVGYGLLLLLGRGTSVGRFIQDEWGTRLLFTWPGAAIAAAVMALPLFVRTGAAALATVDTELLEVGRTLGASEARLFFAVLVPLAFRGLLAALTLAFARALGEFGATLMVAGSIPGRTQTLPLALYAAVQSGDDAAALRYALALTLTAIVLISLVGLWSGRIAASRGER